MSLQNLLGAMVEGRATRGLRPYQALIANVIAGPGNHVVVLATGAGKTLISFELIFQALERHPTKIAVFLAPTVALVNQQQQDFEEEAQAKERHLVSGILAGGKRQNIGRCQILFATPGSVVDELSLERVSLLVLDEVHHTQARKATGHHPYSLIADAYARAEPRRRPKVLGLTASPGESPEQAEQLLSRWQAQLVQLEDLQELRKEVPEAELVAESVWCSQEFSQFFQKATRLRCELQKDQSRLKPDTYEFNLVTEDLKALNELTSRVRCLGWSGLGSQLRVLDSLQPAWQALKACPGASPCYELLLSLLEEARSESFRGIIFVETRAVCYELVQVLKSVGSWLRPSSLVGHSKRDEVAITIKEQREILADFRKGVSNVMVATSVAEEGIDIPSCQLVVRMEPATTVIRFIQARGRARARASRYVVICCNHEDHQVVMDVVAREKQMQQHLRVFRPSVEAENCWFTSCRREPEPLLAFESRPMPRDFQEITGVQQKILGITTVHVECLANTQATVRHTFSDGRCLMETMVNLVRDPGKIQQLPLMRVAAASSSYLGRRAFREEQLMYSLDNRRCFIFKVLGPWLPRVKVQLVNWTDEFDCKLRQCPQRGQVWSTDNASMEDVRRELLERLEANSANSLPCSSLRALSPKRPRDDFDPDADYVSKLNQLMQWKRRPHSGQHLATYRQVNASFVMEVSVGSRSWTGTQQRTVKAAKQSAAFAAWSELMGDGMHQSWRTWRDGGVLGLLEVLVPCLGS